MFAIVYLYYAKFKWGGVSSGELRFSLKFVCAWFCRIEASSKINNNLTIITV